MKLEDGVDPYEDEPDPRFYWHPRIEFAFWVIDWCFVALCYAFIWQYISTPQLFDGVGPLNEDLYISIGARTGWIVAVIAFFVFAITIVEGWYRVAIQHVRRVYKVSDRVLVTFVSSVPFLIVLVVYCWISLWTLDAIWDFFVISAIDFNTGSVSRQHNLSGIEIFLWVGGIVVICGALIRSLIFTSRVLISHYAAAFHHYGYGGTVKGMLIMLLMRVKAPRKDFFLQTPIVNNALPLAISLWLYILVPIPGLNLIAAALLAMWSAFYTFDLIVPPVWLFLGASSFESAFVFHDLRKRWLPRLGVTLLDRDNPAWSAHYRYEAEQLAKRGVYWAKHLNNPSAPRMWSLRTRNDLWQQGVLVLMDFVALIVIDARIVRDGLKDELDWLCMLKRVEKTWILGVDDKESPALIDALSEEVDGDAKCIRLIERVVSGDRLYAASWGEGGLQLPDSA